MENDALPSATPIRYTLRFPAPATHYVEVEACVPTDGRAEVELMMAVWTPGSYLVREYARNVETVRANADDGRELAVTKVAKNRWRVGTGGAAEIRMRYRVFAHEMSVRTNWVEDGFAMLNGAPTFLTLAGDRGPRRHIVRVERPVAWARTASALDAIEGDDGVFVAPDFDTLVDSPIVLGDLAVYELTVDGIGHRLVNVGEAGVWDGPRSARDVERVVRAARDFWGFLPYDRYTVFNMLTEARGGLEHATSTVLMASRWATRTDAAYRDWLGLLAHELFHAWNVKRLRPVELGPFDYERENHTRTLWIAEGLTEYYGDLLVRRAGLATGDEYLATLSAQIRDLQSRPGRLVMPVESAAFDAWIKQYRPDENTRNVTVDYYGKGAVIGALLDARIRLATRGARSLDDVMRTAYERHGGERGYTSAEFRAIASEVAGVDLTAFFHHALETTGELDYAPLLECYGLRFRAESDGAPTAWLGVTTRDDEGRTIIAGIARDTPAYGSGIAVEDELVAIDGFRIHAGGLGQRLEQYRPGDQIELLVARRDELRRYAVTLGAAPRATWTLEVDPGATVEQVVRRREWIGE